MSTIAETDVKSYGSTMLDSARLAVSVNKKEFTLVCVLAIGAAGTILVELWLLKLVIDSLYAGNHKHAFWQAVGAGIFLALSTSLNRIQSNWQLQLGERMLLRLEQDIYSNLSKRPYIDHLYNPLSQDDISLFQQKKMWVSKSLWGGIGAIQPFLVLSLGVILLTSIHWLVSVTVVLLISMFIYRASTRRIEPPAARKKAVAAREAAMTDACIERASSESIRMFGAGQGINQECIDLWVELGDLERVEAKQEFRQELWNATVSAISVAAAVGVVAALIHRGYVSLGALLFIVAFMVVAGRNASILITSFNHSRRGAEVLAAVKRLQADRGDRHNEIHKPVSTKNLEKNGAINLHDISYTYPNGSQKALEKTNLAIPDGATIAVVGPHGAGKSTFVNIILGLQKPDNGTLTVGPGVGVKLDESNIDSWHEHVTSAFQEVQRFELSLADNIALGSLEAADASRAVRRASRLVGIDEFAAHWPQGFDTYLGREKEGGVNLSGGQWQKVGLARALVKEGAWVRVLDEPFANLDAPSERNLVSQFSKISRETVNLPTAITIFVTHRLSIARRADLIVVIVDGCITEVGSHAELIGSGGFYARNYKLQVESYVE